MTAIVEINTNNPQAGPLLEYLASLPFATVRREPQKSFEEAARECNAVPLEVFIDTLKARIENWPDNA